MAIIVLRIMTKTRIMAAVSDLPIAPVKGFIKPIKTRRVSGAAMCATILFSFLTPLLSRSSATPINVGIKAVMDGLSEEK